MELLQIVLYFDICKHRPPPPPGQSGVRKNSPVPLQMAGVDVLYLGMVISDPEELQKECTGGYYKGGDAQAFLKV